MTSRRGFLDSILKAGVSAMIMPSAVTYAGRVWKKRTPYSLLYEHEFEYTHIRFLPSLQDFLVWQSNPYLGLEMKWPKNMGNIVK